ALFFFFNEGAVEGDEKDVGGDGDGGDCKIEPGAAKEGLVVDPQEGSEEAEAEPHETRRRERQEDTQGNTEQEDNIAVETVLFRSAFEKIFMQQIVDYVGVDFNARVVGAAAVRRGFDIADAGGRGADQNNLSAE